MSTDTKNKKQIILGLLLLTFIVLAIYWLVTSIWSWFASLNSDLALGLLTASTTIIVATATLVMGRYFERSKEAESHLREQKILMYDEFLKKFFELFYKNKEGEPEDLVAYLQEWQRKLVVWGGPGVLISFIKWKEGMATSEPNAQTVFLMGEFFMSMRKDIGLSNSGLQKGIFSHLILRHASLFLAEARKNPNITLAELSNLEKELGLE